MRFGVCTDWTMGRVLADAGFDYIELNAAAHLKALDPEPAFSGNLAMIKQCPLPCEAANCFVPGHIKITGPDADMKALQTYVVTLMERAQRAGISTIVFGSGGARRVPDSFDRGEAYRQLVAFGRMVGPAARRHGVTVAVEPLNRKECNIFNSVSECAAYVREVADENVRLLVDSYHWALEKEPPQAIEEAASLLIHVHISTFQARKAPGLEPCDFTAFFRALKRGGYDGRISVEAAWDDMAKQAKSVLAEMKKWLAAAG